MRNSVILFAAAFALSGCLETTEPVFDDSNAMPLSESAQFVAFVDFMEAAGASMGGDDGSSPRELLDQGAFGKEIGDFVLVQSADEGKYSYMAVGVVGDRAYTCFMMPDEEIGPIAAAYGITIAPPDPEAGGMPGAQAMLLEGDPAKVAKFIEDQLSTAPLLCMSVSRGQAQSPL